MSLHISRESVFEAQSGAASQPGSSREFYVEQVFGDSAVLHVGNVAIGLKNMRRSWVFLAHMFYKNNVKNSNEECFIGFKFHACDVLPMTWRAELLMSFQITK